MLSLRIHGRNTPLEIKTGDSQETVADLSVLASEAAADGHLRDVVFTSPRGARRISAIEEDTPDEILFNYLSAYAAYGESFFLFAEIAGTRDCVEDYIASSGVAYESIGECGLAIADRYLGIPGGAMKYMDGYRLCEDVMASRGPAEIEGCLTVVQAMDRDEIYLFDMSWQTPAQEQAPEGPR